MEKILKNLEEKLENYTTSLEEKPITTIIKTIVVIWLFKKAKQLLK